MSDWPALPIFVAVAGRPIILLGHGEGADAKRRLLERAGAIVTDDARADARLAIVAIEDDDAARAAVDGLRARGVLVNAVDRPELCDFTLPAIVDRAPVLIAVGTGGVSAGLAATLRQRLEVMLPGWLGATARRLRNARADLRAAYPDAGQRRRRIAAALGPGGLLDLDRPPPARVEWPENVDAAAGRLTTISLRSGDPDDLTLRDARALATADRVVHHREVPAAIRAAAAAPPAPPYDGAIVWLEMDR